MDKVIWKVCKYSRDTEYGRVGIRYKKVLGQRVGDRQVGDGTVEQEKTTRKPKAKG